MRTMPWAALVPVALLASSPVHAPPGPETPSAAEEPAADAAAASIASDRRPEALAPSAEDTLRAFTQARYERDVDAMRTYRPGFKFWHHVLTIPNGRIAFGSALDGQLLASFPVRGGWLEQARWAQVSIAELFADEPVRGRLERRREATARRLEQAAGPVLHHATRGSFIARGAERYGSFLAEWGAIFERFGVPAELGLAQGLIESGLRGRIRSEAEAIGFCQWLPGNWARLERLSPGVIEAYNQTTQAPYCAAYLTVLATKYGSFIPALSEHHAGSVNVGRTIINGGFAGGDDIRTRYFLGAELTLLVRQIRPPGYREVVGTYGPRSFRYSEMVFGNTATIGELEAAVPQERIFAMRAPRSIPLDGVTQRTGLSVDEVRRYNPALINRVPAGANLYLPFHVEDFGTDVAFWHRPPDPAYAAVLEEFLRLEQHYAPEDWSERSVVESLHAFAERFRSTGTEEGTIMAAAIRYAIEESSQRRRQILAEFRSSEHVLRLLEEGVRKREALLPVAHDTSSRARRNALLMASSLSVQ